VNAIRCLVFLLLPLICPATHAGAQCLSGDCSNGTGEYDFGWCTYKGQFRDGKAEGEGTMKYSDYTYSGHFSKGVEDGEGTIVYSNGKAETVRYDKGRKLATGPAKLAVGEYKELGRDPNCTSGDCVNGPGVYQFPSGNKYSGNFRDRKREGQGTATFANGDSFTGTWHDDVMSSGTYSFAQGARYSGSYDSKGMEQTGKMTIGTLVVTYVDGVAHVPPPPPAVIGQSRDKAASAGPAYRPCCPDCHCLGQKHETYSWAEGRTEVRNGIRSSVMGSYSRCSRCSGTGHVDPPGR
jgi:hypothetical protein